jgi:hypothetical protein
MDDFGSLLPFSIFLFSLSAFATRGFIFSKLQGCKTVACCFSLILFERKRGNGLILFNIWTGQGDVSSTQCDGGREFVEELCSGDLLIGDSQQSGLISSPGSDVTQNKKKIIWDCILT